jgi:hypothetical protein
MSVVPVFQPPVRPRNDTAPSPLADRRSTDAAKDRFADSLATARSGRIANRGADRPTAAGDGCLSPRSDRPNTGTKNSDTDESSAIRAHQSVQQRAQTQALLMRGAMKFAVTRNDAAQEASASANAAPQMAVSNLLVAPDIGEDPTMPIAEPAFENPAAPAVSDAQAITVTVQSMPEIVAPAVQPSVDDTAPATNADAATDMSTSNAATAAALQLVASLPIDVTTPAPTPVESDNASASAAQRADGAIGRLTSNVAFASLPAAVDTVLVEDHFDAPASALDATSSSAATSASTGYGAENTSGSSTSGSSTSGSSTSGSSTSGSSAGASHADASSAIASSGSVESPVSAASTINTASASTPTDPVGAAVAAHTASGTGVVDIAGLQSDIAKLAPEFRERLERVIDRMKQEYGHAVRVIETVRTQARQDALFAQGRTAPGPVVTWTRNSKHGKGLAADLMVDGQWQNPEGYAHLAEIAKQEGLRTLGARDSGHVEMPTDAAVSSETLGNLLNDLQGDAGDKARQVQATVSSETPAQSHASAMARVANVAQVARVSTVASVASVARVANVARPGEAMPQSSQNSDTFTPLAVSAVTASAASNDSVSTMRVATPASAVNLADRISHLMDLQATQDAKPLNSVLLRMDNAGGIEDQIRIDTRGTSVDARLGLGNAQQAAALTDRIGELREALERRGLTADGVRVQATTAPRTIDGTANARAVAPVLELAAMRAASDSQAHGNTRDQSARDQAQREAFARDHSRNTPRPSTDDARQRSRREQPEDRR